MIGLSRSLKLDWLNAAARLRQENLPLTECKARLTDLLSREIKSSINVSKTREILLRVWIYDGAVTSLRQEAATLLKNSSDALPIHWSLLLVTYPIFAKLCKIIGRLFELSEVITTRQIKRKLFDELGEGSTLYYSADKIISTLKNFGALTVKRPGEFISTPQIISDEKIIALMIRAAMQIEKSSYYKVSELGKFNELYPFSYRVPAESLAEEKIFTITNFGGEQVVILQSPNCL
ncbi:MAG: hypothetical protein SR3Q1_11855 [Quinella sp. 3Q1]|nr:hypothetical protein [Quinella sp. 3Q1]